MGTLLQYGWCSFKRRKFGHTKMLQKCVHTEERQREDTVRRQPFARREASLEAIPDNTLFRLPASRTVRKSVHFV